MVRLGELLRLLADFSLICADIVKLGNVPLIYRAF
jgi:hypothetical protein